MQFLEFSECLHYIVIISKFLGKITQPLLSLKILLEIKVAEVAVDFDHIIELLYIVLIGIVYIPVVLRRDGTDRPPLVLNLTEFRESSTDILLLLNKGLKLLDNSLLGCKVVGSLLLKLLIELRTLSLVIVVQ